MAIVPCPRQFVPPELSLYYPVGMQSDTRPTLTGIVAVNVATLGWATNITIGRYVRGEIGPLTLTAARHVVAAIVFTLLLRHVSPEERRSGRNLLPLLGMAAAGIVFFLPRYCISVCGIPPQ